MSYCAGQGLGCLMEGTSGTCGSNEVIAMPQEFAGAKGTLVVLVHWAGSLSSSGSFLKSAFAIPTGNKPLVPVKELEYLLVLVDPFLGVISYR